MWRNDTKCKYMPMFPLKNLAHKGLKGYCVTDMFSVVRRGPRNVGESPDFIPRAMKKFDVSLVRLSQSH